MSLLRDILKKDKDGAGVKKSDSASIKSAGARSLVASLYSLTIGGERVKKRRRPDFSTLGAPLKWSDTDSAPPPPDMPGTVSRTASDFGAYTIAHATVVPLRIGETHHWLSLVLYNHGNDTSLAAMYHNEARVAGQVRLCLEKTKSIASIDVWLSATAPSGQVVSLTANVWNRQKGNPLRTEQKPGVFKDKFPKGTCVFPFELPPLPKFVPVKHPDNDTKALVPLPPSGKINFMCGVGVTRDSFGGISEDMDMILQYIPLTRRLARPPTPFPYLTSREDWPFKRETIGGWVLSPFGGRGRIGAEIVEVEGILGIQDPAVYTAGQIVEFVVLLWSKNADALKLLGQPAAVRVGYYKADFLPSSEVLRPREQSRQTRMLERMADGRAWLADAGRPQDGQPASELVLLDLPMATTPELKTRSSRMQSWTAENEDGVRPPSPVRSIEDDLPVTEHYQRLEGQVRIPPCRPVSYRYTEAGREYSLRLQITHPQYAHISPTGPGLIAEVPIWYVSERQLTGGPEALNGDAAYLASLRIKGATIPVGEDAVVWPKTIGEKATQARQGKPKIGQSFVGLVPPTKEAS